MRPEIRRFALAIKPFVLDDTRLRLPPVGTRMILEMGSSSEMSVPSPIGIVFL